MMTRSISILAAALESAPAVANGKAKPAWRKLPGKVTHVFTHFPLELVVYATAVPAGTRAVLVRSHTR